MALTRMTHAVIPESKINTTLSAPNTQRAREQTSPTLAELQDLFQRAVLNGDAAVLNLIPGNGRTTADVLLGVYQHAYRGRLAEILGVDYPLLQRYMEQEAFDEMAYAYIGAHPSDTPNVRWFGRHLPKFLETTAPYSSRQDYSELATLEHALAKAFDAADAPVLTLEDLQGVPPEAWTTLTFQPHSSATRLSSCYATYERWKALQDGEAHSDIPCEQTTSQKHLIVWRKNEVARVRLMSDEEAMMWDEASRGVSFGQLCALVATYDDAETAPIRAAQYLQSWISAQLLTSASTS